MNIPLLLLRFAAVALFLAGRAGAQQSGPFSELLEVRIQNLDVIVTDSEGKFVSGLTPPDFIVVEEGKPQDVTNVAEYVRSARGGTIPAGPPANRAAETTSPRPPRRLILYFDNTSLDPFQRNELIEGARRVLREQSEDGDEFLVAAWSGKLDIRQPWTQDLRQVEQTLAEFSREGGQASAREANRKIVVQQIDAMVLDENWILSTPNAPPPTHTFDMLIASARNYAESVRNDVVRSAAALAKLLASIAGTEGRKVLVFAAQSFPLRPGADLFEHIDRVRREVSANPRSVIGETARRAQPLAEVAALDTSKVVTALTSTANAAGVTIYAVNPRASDSADRNEGSADLTRPADGDFEFARNAEGRDGLQVLANETGGLAFVGAPPAVALDTVTRDFGTYYSIAYRSRPGAPASRTVEVRVKKPGLRVRARRNVTYRAPADEMADGVVATQLQDRPPNDLGISLQHGAVHVEESRRTLPVNVLIPVDHLILLRDGEQAVGGFSVFICSGDGRGDVSGVNMQTHQIRWPAEAPAALAGKQMTYTLQVPLSAGRDRISIGVIDHVSQVKGFANLQLTASSIPAADSK